MQIIIEDRDRQAILEIERKQQEIDSLLRRKTYRQTAPWLRTLSESLLTYSHCHALLKLTAKELLDWLQVFLDFLSDRQDLASIAPFQPKPDETYLLINTPDVPYVVDSLQNLLTSRSVRATIISHPILAITREDGRITALENRSGGGGRESFMLLEMEQDQVDLEPLAEAIRELLATAQTVGQQQAALAERLGEVRQLKGLRGHADFIDWLQQGNFVCFGYTPLEIQLEGRTRFTVRLDEAPIGLPLQGIALRRNAQHASKDLDRELRQRLLRKENLLVEVLDQISPLHRNEPLVYIGFREEFSTQHWREHVFVGLFSQQSINQLSMDVPPLRQKLMAALERLQIPRNSYDYRKVLDIFNTFPKVEMFFLDAQHLDNLVRSFISLQRQDKVKVVLPPGQSLRAVILLVIMPASYYSPESVRRMEAYLKRYFQADRIDTRIIHSYSQYLSLHIRILPGAGTVRADINRLEKMLTEQARPWDERLRLLLLKEFGRHRSQHFWANYAKGFTPEYKAFTHPRFAVRDIRAIERMRKSETEVFDLWGPFKGESEYYRLQFYSPRRSDLNELMPLLENLNLAVVDEVDFTVSLDGTTVYIKSFSVRNANTAVKPLSQLRRHLLETLRALRRGELENDYLNRLLVLTGLDWKAIDVFRAYRNYYFQLGNPFTKRRVAFALINNPQVALLLYRYFEARFRPNSAWTDPLTREEEAMMPVRLELAGALDAVQDINEDRILRSLFNLIDSTIRTNYFLRRDTDHYFLSFKISAIGIIEMPFPRPLYETYVHSATMEGIHLRGGKVARGGIRWSDRPDDFRTEVLGLMKAQMTKNAVIVPVGSKGGFVVKTPYTTREEGGELSRQAYITLMQGLLDLTDNRIGGEIRTPEGIVAYDGPDPYLVVAADKGTAHLPDTANEVSAGYHFWLSDAFASGGTHGYDHKKYGVTARGAWESVKRHFRERGKDIQNEPFTAVGIGDMSGDVFGNGMLLSRQTRLLAAFDHRHIFIDPDPDPERSWLERDRLFKLPRSTWDDYDRSLISKGGGIWPRQAKDIPLSDEVKRWLGVRHNSIDGDGLIRQILMSDAELLWNGGIGTYVKANLESHAEVGDRTNDGVRVDASQLRCKVVGEGGNLGLTQRARIEFALLGGMINTDSVDNSGGVDTSDHEVNLKILMQQMLEARVLKTANARNKLLLQIQEEVCERVWENNYAQSLCLSLDLCRSHKDPEPYLDLIDRLVNSGLLDRKGEFLPSRKELAARDGGLTRPELAILMSYAKMNLYQALLESDLPDQDAARHLLYNYFPEVLQKKYAAQLDQHPLRREIVATVVTNAVIDQAGSSFVNSLVRQSGADPVEVAKAYLLFDRVLDGTQTRRQVFSLDNQIPADAQYRLLLDLEEALASLCSLSLELNLPVDLTDAAVDAYAAKLVRYRENLPDILGPEEWAEAQATAQRLEKEGLSPDASLQIATLRYLVAFLPTVSIAEDAGADIFLVTRAMNEIRHQLSLPVVNSLLEQLPINDRWDRLAQIGLRKAIMSQVFILCRKVVVESGGQAGPYLQQRRQRFQYYRGLVEAMQGSPPASTSPFTVLMRALEGLHV